MKNIVRALGLIIALTATPVFAQTAQHGLALHGTPRYPADFQHFDYVNPNAPKGGDIHLSALGTYDTLNPFTLKGLAADGAALQFETLMAASMDEPMSQYGWIAESVTVAPDHSWVSYKIRPTARFHDGSPITADDVIFSFETLRDKGHPFYRSYYKDVVKAEKLGEREVKFTFRDTTNTELPLIMGQLPVLCKKFWQGKDFAATTLDPVMGSGPYEVDSMTPGRTISYKRVKDWWAKDLPINRGRYNFDVMRFDYYRDTTVSLEAFLRGSYDFRLENVAKNWALGYDTDAVRNGNIVKDTITNQLPAGMQGFVFNMRRDLFKDRRVREALNYAFDFEWSNKNFAYNAYTRTQSYFENSELAARGMPSADELKLLEPYRNQLPPELFTEPFKLPTTDGSGDNRDNMRKAAELLREAGWTLKNGVLVDANGKPLTFEIIDAEPMFERWTQPLLRNLERLGIKATFRIVDAAQFQNRMDNFDFDVTVSVFSQSLSPGNEQFDYWSSTKADVHGSRNLIGVHDPVVDALLEKLVHATSREDLVTACHALDRVLLWQYYVIPHWHIDSFRIAYWNRFGQPATHPPYGLAVDDTWWVDTAKAAKLDAQHARGQ
ncbi:MAG: ABC transporter substrate-binding protein [Alphaproteobacteria bacterium]|nr:ABC transporter substrate-binding protein [Alphaproteobacteria bacterium]MBV8549471.1 ABC transporter substrate-binding protein [Alphaproteobacteria bacterium]